MRITMIAATLVLTFALNAHAKVLVMDVEDLRALKVGSFSKLENLMNISKPLPKTTHKLKKKVHKKKTAHKAKKARKLKKKVHKAKKVHKTKKAHKTKKTGHKFSEYQIRQSGYVVGNMNEIRSELDYCIQSAHNNKFLAVGQNQNGNIFRSAAECNDDSAFSFSRTVPGQNRWKIRSLKNLEFVGVDQFSGQFQMLKTQPRVFTKRQVWIPSFLNSADQAQRKFRITNYASGGNFGIGNGKVNPQWQMITWRPNTYVGQKFKIVVR